ncbi:hypothetical protein BR93DRAFT_620189 [Coniochaeta sp. PMI_546]|nr:hypothetical protein BR93DRAFT_620189 [Coniochaeta sp. PMI_546]
MPSLLCSNKQHHHGALPQLEVCTAKRRMEWEWNPLSGRNQADSGVLRTASPNEDAKRLISPNLPDQHFALRLYGLLQGAEPLFRSRQCFTMVLNLLFLAALLSKAAKTTLRRLLQLTGAGRKPTVVITHEPSMASSLAQCKQHLRGWFVGRKRRRGQLSDPC